MHPKNNILLFGSKKIPLPNSTHSNKLTINGRQKHAITCTKLNVFFTVSMFIAKTPLNRPLRWMMRVETRTVLDSRHQSLTSSISCSIRR